MSLDQCPNHSCAEMAKPYVAQIFSDSDEDVLADNLGTIRDFCNHDDDDEVQVCMVKN